MKRYYFLSLIYSFFSCNNNPNCTITATEIFHENDDKVFVVDDHLEGNPIIRDKGIDSIKGGEYLFTHNSRLKSYRFFQTAHAYTYSEEYDNNGRLIKIVGKPLVNTKIREVNKDSAFFAFSFFALNKVYEKLHVSIDDSMEFILPFERDTLYSNMNVASFGVNTKGLVRFKLYLSSDFKDSCELRLNKFRDTISFVKNPILNFE